MGKSGSTNSVLKIDRQNVFIMQTVDLITFICHILTWCLQNNHHPFYDNRISHSELYSEFHEE